MNPRNDSSLCIAYRLSKRFLDIAARIKTWLDLAVVLALRQARDRKQQNQKHETAHGFHFSPLQVRPGALLLGSRR